MKVVKGKFGKKEEEEQLTSRQASLRYWRDGRVS
jgi:hypothetical protein